MRKSPHKLRNLTPLCLIDGVDDLDHAAKSVRAELLKNAIRDKSSSSFVILEGNKLFVLETSKLAGHFKVSENTKNLVGVYNNSAGRLEILEDLNFVFIPSQMGAL